MSKKCKGCTGGMYRRNATLKHRYGITVDEYDRMLEYQAGGCAICGTAVSQDGRALAVDHDHTTGAVRGLLCANCNKGLGLFNDDINLLDNAINYIRKPNV